jgi:hypothetical protein
LGNSPPTGAEFADWVLATGELPWPENIRRNPCHRTIAAAVERHEALGCLEAAQNRYEESTLGFLEREVQGACQRCSTLQKLERRGSGKPALFAEIQRDVDGNYSTVSIEKQERSQQISSEAFNIINDLIKADPGTITGSLTFVNANTKTNGITLSSNTFGQIRGRCRPCFPSSIMIVQRRDSELTPWLLQ